ncbi:MAG TPA: pyruvate kinase [Noviherbaspirillum sp.]|nr:pyruvate kinase [Noviherbaspirillum sp.]
MRRQRNTKIIATLGPSTASRQDIRNLFEAGADLFRMDMRYGTHADHHARFCLVREVEQEVGRPIGVLMDLQGPKLRIGSFRQTGVELVPGQRFVLDSSPGLGDHNRVSLPHPEVFRAVSVGNVLFLDDGPVRLSVESVEAETIVSRVEIGGLVRDGGCIKAPNVHMPIASLTTKDADDLDFGLTLGVDWVALAFVQNEQDVLALRERIGPGNAPKIIAKVEKPSSLEHLEKIVNVADAVMVCRAELGVELEIEEMPIAQRRIVRACRARGRPVVIATQMLDSMVNNPAPTRAEAGDAAAAVYDGVDAVMLSAETAIGRYFVESVVIMSRIVRCIEGDPGYNQGMESLVPALNSHDSAYAISAAIRTTADMLPLSFTAAWTESGSTCLAVARVRPPSPILGFSPSLVTARMLTLVWGVHPVCMEDASSVEVMVENVVGAAHREGFAKPGHPFVMVAGMPFGTRGAANLMRIGWA